MSRDTYDPVARKDQDPTAKGRECSNCGHPGYEHDLERVQHENGYSYDYLCPDES